MFESLVRPALSAVDPYLPGKPIAELERELGLKKRIVKLASNENPLGVSPRARAELKRALGAAGLYPEGASPLLRRAVARAVGVEPSWIIVGNGSDEVARLLCEACLDPGDEVVLSQYAFIRFRQQAALMGARLIVVPARALAHDLAAMARAATPRTKLLFIANPNNPTGTYASQAELKGLLGAVPRKTVVVLDEAYYEFARLSPDYPESLPGLVRAFPNLAVVRTFSKAYGLAGLRVGYGVARAELVAQLDRIRMPFNVGLLSQRAAQAALSDSAFLRRSLELVRREKPRLERGLSRLGLHPLPSAANFLCVECPVPGRRLFEALLREGVIIRPLEEYALPRHVRISIGSAAQNRRLLAALGRVLKPLGAPRSGAARVLKRRRRGYVIAMDGPAGVGKSSVGRFLARRLGYRFINTGEMYRVLTWKALAEGIDPKDAPKVVALARRLKWEFKPIQTHVLRTYVDGVLADRQIRTEEVSQSSSLVAGIPGVRRFMRDMQRRIGREGGVVMEGRDITTNVFPDAEFKFYLDASIAERALRRYRQLKAQGLPAKLREIRKAIRDRDLYDSRRKINPLSQAADAHVIDSTRLTMRQVAGGILRQVRSGAGSAI